MSPGSEESSEGAKDQRLSVPIGSCGEYSEYCCSGGQLGACSSMVRMSSLSINLLLTVSGHERRTVVQTVAQNVSRFSLK